MEFVLVTFPVARAVEMDGVPQGQTGQMFGVQRGHHVFDLGSPVDYKPPFVPTVVAGTTQANPMVIAFQPTVGAVAKAKAKMAPAPLAPKRMRKSAKRGAKASQQRKPKQNGVSAVTQTADVRRAGATKATRRKKTTRNKR